MQSNTETPTIHDAVLDRAGRRGHCPLADPTRLAADPGADDTRPRLFAPEALGAVEWVGAADLAPPAADRILDAVGRAGGLWDDSRSFTTAAEGRPVAVVALLAAVRSTPDGDRRAVLPVADVSPEWGLVDDLPEFLLSETAAARLASASGATVRSHPAHATRDPDGREVAPVATRDRAFLSYSRSREVGIDGAPVLAAEVAPATPVFGTSGPSGGRAVAAGHWGHDDATLVVGDGVVPGLDADV